ncbi:MAG: tetratricopeptide repeat protein, partial [Sandaracinaceae bacterium]
MRGWEPGALTLVSLALVVGCGGAEGAGQPASSPATACEGGDAAACLSLGRAFETGDGVEVDVAQAIVLYERACEGGEGRGCTAAGSRYHNGDGTTRNPARARSLFERGCEANDALACYDLAVLLGGPR